MQSIGLQNSRQNSTVNKANKLKCVGPFLCKSNKQARDQSCGGAQPFLVPMATHLQLEIPIALYVKHCRQFQPLTGAILAQMSERTMRKLCSQCLQCNICGGDTTPCWVFCRPGPASLWVPNPGQFEPKKNNLGRPLDIDLATMMVQVRQT